MKTIVRALALALCLLILVSCGSGEETENRAGEKKLSGVEELLKKAEEKNAATGEKETAAPAETAPAQSAAELRAYLEKLRAMTPVPWESKADIDLTAMSSTMVYSQVSEMMTSPDRYLGKTVKMRGTMSIMESTDRNYYACIIKDATACCASGIEFVPVAAFDYPADYPKDGAEVIVIGVFDTYTEGTARYCQLIAAQMKAA